MGEVRALISGRARAALASAVSSWADRLEHVGVDPIHLDRATHGREGHPLARSVDAEGPASIRLPCEHLDAPILLRCDHVLREGRDRTIAGELVAAIIGLG